MISIELFDRLVYSIVQNVYITTDGETQNYYRFFASPCKNAHCGIKFPKLLHSQFIKL